VAKLAHGPKFPRDRTVSVLSTILGNLAIRTPSLELARS
jgi:hypothetical protein